MNHGKVATVSGRYYSMNRDNNFNRLRELFTCLTTMNIEESVTCPFVFELPSLDNILSEYLEKIIKLNQKQTEKKILVEEEQVQRVDIK